MVIQPDPNFIATDEFLAFDVAIFDFRNQNPLAQDEKVQANLLKFLGQPKGLVTVHWANGAFPYWPEYVNIVGRAQQSVHDRRRSFMVKIVSPNHPITREMKDYETNDELFWDTKIGNRTITPVAVATSNVHFADFPMALELQYNRARVQHHHGTRCESAEYARHRRVDPARHRVGGGNPEMRLDHFGHTAARD